MQNAHPPFVRSCVDHAGKPAVLQLAVGDHHG
jgi:hypothetical protein